jgi:Spy/CpxP family protein refolding chaperone
MKRTAMVMSLVAVLALTASAALAWGPGRGMGGGRGNGFPAIPNLTAEQSSKITALREAHLKGIEPLQQGLLTKRTELRALWQSSNPDEAAIKAKQKEILDLRSQLQDKATDLRLEIRKLLTPEQQAQMAAFGPGAGPGMGRMGGMGGMGRMGGRW